MANKKFSIKSNKVKFLVVAVLVAFIGGSWQVYKSFADTRVYTCTPSSCLNARFLGVNASAFTDSSKNNTQVYKLTKDGQAFITKKGVQVGRKYNVCAEVYGSGSFNYYVVSSGGPAIGPSTFMAQSTITPVCWSVIILATSNDPPSYLGAGYRDLSVEVTAKSGEIKVKSIYVDLLGDQVNNIPSSTPTK